MIDRIWIVIILAAGISVIMGYSYTTYAYYPKLAHDRDVGQTMVGLILGVDSIVFMILSLLAPMLMKKFGRKLWLVVSLFFCGVAVFIFAWLSFIDDKTLFLIVSFASRLTIGGTMSLYMTTAYSFVAILYKENVQKGIGRLQSAIGIGPIVWLVSSSFIFKWFGYFVTFAALSSAFGIIWIAILIWVHNFKEEAQESQEVKPIKSKYIFYDLRIIGAFLNAGIAMALINAPSSLVADRFEEFDMPEWLKGLTFLFSNIPFTIVSLLLHRFSTSTTSNRSKSIKQKLTIMSIGYVSLWIGFILIGPSSVFHLPQEVWFILIGFSFFGVAYSTLIVSNIPLLQDYAMQYDTVNEEYNRIVNVLSGLFNLLFGLGAFLGPLLSPNFKNLLGYRGFTDIFALITIIGFAIFLALSMMPLSSNLKNHFIRERSNSSGINQSPDGFINDFDKETQVGEPLISK